MTQQSMLVGANPAVVIKAGLSVTVRGVEGDRLTAASKGPWGLKIEKQSPAQFMRARAAVGDHVLFDLRLNRPNFQAEAQPEEIIVIQIGGSGEVQVPSGAVLKVYAGKDISVSGIQGRVDAFAGLNLSVSDVYCLGNASAGWSMSLDCQTVAGEGLEYKSGSDLRFYVRQLSSAQIRVKDLGGFWEARIGGGATAVSLKSGGDVTLVSAYPVEGLPPDYVLGQVESPPAS